MNSEVSIETRLARAFSEPMGSRERTFLDAGLANLRRPVAERRGYFRLRSIRAVALAAAVLILVPTAYAVGVGILGEAPYGLSSARQYEAELAAAKRVTPIPPGMTWPVRLERAPDPKASYGTGLGGQMVELSASCMWFGYWLDQQREGSDATRATALRGVQAMRTWRTFTDPNTTDQGLREEFQMLIASAERGEQQPIRAYLTANCGG